MSEQTNITTGSESNLAVSLLLWFFLGYGIGAHNYYLGRTGIGIAQLIIFILAWPAILLYGFGIIMFIALGIWWLVDLVYIFQMSNKSNIISVGSSKSTDNLEELEKLHSLFEKGILTEEQYTAKKAKLMETL